MKISVLEDDDAQAELMSQWLTDAGHEINHSANCKQFIESFALFNPDLAILDWELPDGTGVEVLETIRQRFDSHIPILFTTQRDSEEDIVNALKNGADDYLIKPLRLREFSARLAALGRRAGIKNDSDLITEGPFVIDTKAEIVMRDGEPVKLTQKDYAVTVCLFKNLGKALSREYLLKDVWGVNAGLDTRTVDMHVSRVRRALKIGPENGFIIKTIYQHGYRLEKISNS
ncbi:response regulator transcription factor [Agarilytica rhodophyticola]|uniref:response regulator transcription factor n=1 Tax=Agarilytica rhodophyticola TaxID=1737490 RepID=UPI000B345FA7|nr:response regulator transcription factor [Agarilytica rhodophyticola]